jgi:hypothetical protein
MRYRPINLLFMVLIITFLIVKTAAAQTHSTEHNEASPVQTIQQVFLISIDGLNYEGFISSYTPNMNYLANEGVIDKKSRSFTVNSIEASEACLLTGSFPEEHKFISAGDSLEVESLLERVKKSDRKVLMVDASGGKLEKLAAGTYIKVDAKQNDRQVFQTAIEQYNAEHPYFTYIYSNDCLDALLSLNQKNYYQSITKVDQYIGELLDDLRKHDQLDKTLIVITSPRSSSTSNFSPLIMRGPGCKSGVIMTDTMLIDVFPTLSYLLGIKTQFNVRGIPLYEAIAVEPRNQISVLNMWINSLKKERIITWNRYFQSQEELYHTIKQLMAVQEERENIFHYAGQREDTINSLQNKIRLQRWIGGVIFLLMAAGYLVEYRWLKRKFLLFR